MELFIADPTPMCRRRAMGIVPFSQGPRVLTSLDTTLFEINGQGKEVPTGNPSRFRDGSHVLSDGADVAGVDDYDVCSGVTSHLRPYILGVPLAGGSAQGLTVYHKFVQLNQLSNLLPVILLTSTPIPGVVFIPPQSGSPTHTVPFRNTSCHVEVLDIHVNQSVPGSTQLGCAIVLAQHPDVLVGMFITRLVGPDPNSFVAQCHPAARFSFHPLDAGASHTMQAVTL